jgi:hypothetical protein
MKSVVSPIILFKSDPESTIEFLISDAAPMEEAEDDEEDDEEDEVKVVPLPLEEEEVEVHSFASFDQNRSK